MKVFVCLLALAAVAYGYESHKGTKLVEITPHGKQHDVVRKMLNVFDFAKTPGREGDSGHIFARAHEWQALEKQLIEAEIDHKILIDDLSVEIEKERADTLAKGNTRLTWDSYSTYAQIMDYCDELDLESGVTVTTFPSSTFEGRDMKRVTLDRTNISNPNTLFIDGGIHAREWVAPATVTYIMEQMIRYPSPQVTEWLKSVRVNFMPSINPDGYQYTWDSDRLWRKTRSNYDGNLCYGVDPNRNFELSWCGEGTSNSPCSDVYCGPAPYSEVETALVRDEILAAKTGPYNAYFTFHSYGQYILYPYGYTNGVYPPNQNELISIGDLYRQVVASVHGMNYQMGNSADLLYPAAGASDDYAMNKTYDLSYTIELRNTNTFQLPASQIIPTGEENYAAMEAMLEYIAGQ